MTGSVFVKFQEIDGGLKFMEINVVEKACQDLKINQRELAELIGVSTNTVSGWRNGKRAIPKWGYRILELVKLEKEHYQLTDTIKRYKI